MQIGHVTTERPEVGQQATCGRGPQEGGAVGGEPQESRAVSYERWRATGGDGWGGQLRQVSESYLCTDSCTEPLVFYKKIS